MSDTTLDVASYNTNTGKLTKTINLDTTLNHNISTENALERIDTIDKIYLNNIDLIGVIRSKKDQFIIRLR